MGIRNAFDPRVVDQRQTHSSLQLHKCYFQIDSILLRSALVPYLNLTPPMLPTSANRILPWSIMSDTPGSDRNYKSIFLRSLLVSLCLNHSHVRDQRQPHIAMCSFISFTSRWILFFSGPYSCILFPYVFSFPFHVADQRQPRSAM